MNNNKKKWLYRFPALFALLTSLNDPTFIFAAPVAKDFLANDPNATNQIIVRLRPHTLSSQSIHLRVNQLAGTTLAYHRTMGNGAYIYQLAAHTALPYVRQMTARIARDPNVLYAEPNVRRQLIRPLSAKTAAKPRSQSLASLNDPLFPMQGALSMTAGSINAPAAWQVTTGASNIVIGVLDSGALFDHEDLKGRLIAGADFIDGDMNPGDPGGEMGGHPIYHGTYVAGIIGAATNNGLGIAGINRVSKILVVRTIDAAGSSGSIATEADSMRWAAGIPVPGFPNNPTPAKVINFSSAGLGSCTQTEMDAINEVRANGTVVVVAAGNSNLDVSGAAPANCPGVIAVAAIDANANRASFSNFGSGITISAPGKGILTTGGLTAPPQNNVYTILDGTTLAAPHVTGVISLMLSVNPNLSPDDVTRLLKQSARPFPAGANCNGICQAGMLDAGKAVALAAGQAGTPTSHTQPLHVLISPPQTVQPGARVTLAGMGRTAPGARIVSYQWRQVSGPAVRLSNVHIARPSFAAPRTAATLVFQLTVTDSLKRTAGAATRVVVNPAPSTTPQPATPPTSGQPANQGAGASNTPPATPNPPLGGIFGSGPGTLLNTPTQPAPAAANPPPAATSPPSTTSNPPLGGIFGGGPGTLLNTPTK